MRLLDAFASWTSPGFLRVRMKYSATGISEILCSGFAEVEAQQFNISAWPCASGVIISPTIATSERSSLCNAFQWVDRFCDALRRRGCGSE